MMHDGNFDVNFGRAATLERKLFYTGRATLGRNLDVNTGGGGGALCNDYSRISNLSNSSAFAIELRRTPEKLR
jgi:hypothetical protein